jgi:oligoendopeptidase F
MNQTVLRAVLSDLEKEWDRARNARDEAEKDAGRYGTEGHEFENARENLEDILNHLSERILVALEASDLSDTRRRLIEKWPGLSADTTAYLEEYDYAQNRAYEYLSTLVDSLRSACGDGRSSGHAFELAQLETILRKTPVLLRRRAITPTGEMDIQKQMHDYLSAYFTLNINIPLR